MCLIQSLSLRKLALSIMKIMIMKTKCLMSVSGKCTVSRINCLEQTRYIFVASQG